MKYEPKKELKQLLGTKTKPVVLETPALRYLTIAGAGDPNGEAFQAKTQALYSAMYTAKFAYKKTPTDETFTDFVVGPLMGHWSINEEAQAKGSFAKSDFVYQLRIPLPPFLTDEVMTAAIAEAQEKKGFPELAELAIVQLPAMKVGQILHVGSYDDEPASFEKLENFLTEQGEVRKSKEHVEIYLSDPRRVSPEKLKTILQVEV